MQNQPGKPADRSTDRQTDIHAYIQIDRLTDRNAGR